MNQSLPRGVLAAVLSVLVALGVTACGSGSKATSSAATTTTSTSSTTPATTGTSAVVGSHTSVTLNPATSQLLKENEIKLTAVGPATYTKTLVWPVSGGQIATATVTGTIDQNGGFKLTHDEKSVELTTFIINTSTKQVTGLVGEKRIPVYSINTSSEKHQTGAGGVIVDSGLKLTLTEQAATTVNNSLGVNAFKSGHEFGTATVTLAVKT